MQHTSKMAQDGFGWPFWGGMTFSLWTLSLTYWVMFLGPGQSLSTAVGVPVLLLSFAAAGFGFFLFTKIRNANIHKAMTISTAALLALGMITVMLFSEAWSLQKALGVS